MLLFQTTMFSPFFNAGWICFNCALIDSLEGCRTPPAPRERKDIVTFFILLFLSGNFHWVYNIF